MAESSRASAEPPSPQTQYANITERTSLLSSAIRDPNNHGTISSEQVLHDDLSDTEIDEDEFDHLVCVSESYQGRLGIEPESQQTPMLRGPRRYSMSSAEGHSQRQSFASTWARSSVSPHGSTTPVVETDEDVDETAKSTSPFMAGVSVARFWLIFGCILACQFVACFDSTIMVSSHPVITSYFESSNSASWLSTAFLLTSTSFQPIFGRLSDTIGRKSPYVFTVAIFLLSTIWCALAQSMTSFIIARAVCGLGAGGMIVIGSIITSDLVPIEIRGAYQSYINIVYGVGSTLGAATGGAIADHFGWRWEFGLQVPALVICLFIACLFIPKKLGLADGVQKKTLWEAMKVFDFQGSILLTTSITSLILGLNLGGNILPWSHPFIIISLSIAGMSVPLLIYVESQVPLPIMPLELFRHNPRAGMIFFNFIVAIVVNGITFNMPLYFQAVLLESATSSGLRLIVPSLASSMTGTATGFLITWTKRLKPPLVVGVVLVLVGTIGLSAMQKGLPSWSYYLFLVPASMGQGFIFPGTFMSILAVSEQSEQAVVTSILILWRSLGTVLGVASSSLVLQNALVIYLQKFVTGADKDRIISEVRTSVRAITGLPLHARNQVIDAYAAALKATFILAAILSAVAVVITLTVRLPKLGAKRKK